MDVLAVLTSLAAMTTVTKGGKELVEHVRGFTADGRLDKAAEEAWDELATDAVLRLIELSDRLAPVLSEANVADFIAVLKAARRVSEGTADPRVRNALRNAVVNAFEPEVYQQGMTLRLLEIMGKLTYGDMAFLRQVEDAGRINSADGLPRNKDLVFGQTLAAHHVTVLVEHGLVWTSEAPGSPRWGGGRWQIRPTELGLALLALLREPPEPEQTAAAS